jgi:hypothetical protein
VVLSASGSHTETATVTASSVIGGSIAFKDGNTTIGTVSVVNGSASMTTSSLSAGSHTLTAVYSGSDSLLTSTSPAVTHAVNVTPSGPPAIFSATATNTIAVSLSWTSVSGAASYDVFRSSNNSGFASIGTFSGLTATDTGRSPNTTYLYKVKVTGGVTFSPVDAATTIVFTDASITSGTTRALATHIVELRTAVNAMRTAAGLPASSFTDPSLVAGVSIKRVHITEMRTALDAARTTIGLTALSYTDTAVTAGSTIVKRAHITELRSGTQ